MDTIGKCKVRIRVYIDICMRKVRTYRIAIFIYFDYFTVKFRGSGYSNCFVSFTTPDNATGGGNILGMLRSNFNANANTDFSVNITKIWYMSIGKYNGYILPWYVTNDYGNAFISGPLVLYSTINQYNLINYVTIDYKVSLYLGTFQT